MFPGNVGRALSVFDKNDDGLLDFREFVEINGQFPLMLFPAFRLQDNIQAMSLGRVESVGGPRRELPSLAQRTEAEDGLWPIL